MPMKRSSESLTGDRGFLIQSLTKTLCSSPEEAHTDCKGQTHFHQEDDTGIKSGRSAAPGVWMVNSCITLYLFDI